MHPAHRVCRAVICLVCLAAAACSSDESEGSGGQGVSALSCDVAPAQEMASTLGVADLQDPVAETTYGVLVCSYATSTGEHAVGLRMLETGADGFAAGRESFEDQGIVTEDLAGLGQQAYSATDTTGAVASTTVVAWDGVYEVQLSTTGSSVDALRAMVAKVLDRLAQ